MEARHLPCKNFFLNKIFFNKVPPPIKGGRVGGKMETEIQPDVYHLVPSYGGQFIPSDTPDDGFNNSQEVGDDGDGVSLPSREVGGNEESEDKDEVEEEEDIERDGAHSASSYTTLERLLELIQESSVEESVLLHLLKSNPELIAVILLHADNPVIAQFKNSRLWGLVVQHKFSPANRLVQVNGCLKSIRELEISLLSGENDDRIVAQLEHIVPLLKTTPPDRTILDMPIHRGRTLLYFATHHSIEGLILSLLECGASPTVTNERMAVSALHLACIKLDVRIMMKYIEAVEDVTECDKVDNAGETALYCLIKVKPSCEVNSLPQELLLKFDPSIQSEDGNTILHLAVKKDLCPLLRKLLMHHKAAQSALLLNNEGDCVLDLLVDKCLDFQRDYFSCLSLLFDWEASQPWQPSIQHLNRIKRCLLSPTGENEALLIVLLKHPLILEAAFTEPRNSSIFEQLMRRFLTEPTTLVSTVLISLFSRQSSDYYFNDNKDDVVRMLRKALEEDNFFLFDTFLHHHLCHLCAILDNSQNTLLHYACHKKTVPCESLSLLFSHPLADSKLKNKEGDTPLHVACKGGNFVAASLMSEHMQLELSIRNNNGKTALMVMLERCKTLGDFTIPAELVKVFPLEISPGDNMLHVATRMEYSLDFTLHILRPSKGAVLKKSYMEENEEGQTPLYIALKTCQFNKAETLMAAYNPHNRTLLHHVCLHPSLHESFVSLLEIPKYQEMLHCLDKNENTPLHVATSYRFLEALKGLISRDPNLVTMTNKSGQTPLHIACHSRNLEAVDIILRHCPPNIVGVSDGDNWLPLHSACQIGDKDLVKSLLEKDPNPLTSLRTRNIDGDTPFHLLCTMSADLVEYMLTHYEDLRYMLDEQDKAGNTPFHLVLKLGSNKEISNALESLLRYCDSIPMSLNRSGSTVYQDCIKEAFDDPLKIMLRKCPNQLTCSDVADLCRYAVQFEPPRLSKIYHLLTCHEKVHADDSKSSKCEPLDIGGGEKRGLVHFAASINESDLVTQLVEKFCVSATCSDREGDTPLHVACRCGSIDVARYILSNWNCDLREANVYGDTPLSLATSNLSMLSLLNKFQNLSRFKEQYPMDSFCKVFVTGHSGAGKTTFIEVFKSFLGSKGALTRFMRRFQTVSPVRPFTAGIIPTTISGEGVGNFIIYDLAGHFEYHSSHSAILEHLIISSTPIFVLLINMSKEVKEVEEQLLYWLNLLQNQCHQLQDPSPVIIIGSHEDEASNKEEKATRIGQVLNRQEYQSLEEAGLVFMDCRVLSSKGLNTLQQVFSSTCSRIMSLAPKVSLLCHGLYDYLTTGIEKDILALTLGDLSKHLKDKEEDFLPTDNPSLAKLSSTLSDKGLILFLKNSSELGKSWIVVQREALLSEINGLVFAPENFSEHLPLNNSTGLIPKSYLEQAIPQYDMQMMIEFLVHFEFCHLFDEHACELLSKEEIPSYDSENHLLFFPALIRNDPLSKCWPPEDSASSEYNWFSWVLQCIDETQQFFTYRFIHVLILRLALNFALPPANEDSLPLPVVRRRCSIWKNGLRWLSEDGVWVMVHITNNNRTLQLVMASPIKMYLSVVRYRSKIISKILDGKRDFCKGIRCDEVLHGPKRALLPTGEDFKLSSSKREVFSMTEISQRIVNPRDPDELCNITDIFGKHSVSLEDLFLFEAYSGFKTPVLHKLFQAEYQEELISYDFVLELVESMKCIRNKFEPTKIATAIFSLPERKVNEAVRQDKSEFDNCVSVIKLWIEETKIPSYRNLRTCLDELSVFAGRNPLVSSERDERKVLLLVSFRIWQKSNVLAESRLVNSSFLLKNLLQKSVKFTCMLHNFQLLQK